MDPLAHTLVGAGLASTGLRRKTRLAAAALILAANLPDIDALAGWFGRDVSLYWRRGWTHGVLGIALLPLVLAALLYSVEPWLRRRAVDGPGDLDAQARPAVVLPWLVACCYLGALTHPFLDWLNTYGVRLLMPFDGRWFYGDALFIVDPWMWLLAGTAAVVGLRGGAEVHAAPRAPWRRRVFAGLGILLGLGTTWLVTTSDLPPLSAKIVWLVGLGVVTGIAWRGTGGIRATTVARGALGVLSLYIVGSLSVSAWARDSTRVYATAQGLQIESVVAGPVAAQPLLRRLVVATPEDYHAFEWSPFAATPSPIGPPRPRGVLGPEVGAALASVELRGLVNWLRLPAYESEPTPEGFRVAIHDLRPSRRADTTRAVVHVKADLSSVHVEGR